jgi:hypothetical protein
MRAKVDNADPVHLDLGALAGPGLALPHNSPNPFPHTGPLGKIEKLLNEEV